MKVVLSEMETTTEKSSAVRQGNHNSGQLFPKWKRFDAEKERDVLYEIVCFFRIITEESDEKGYNLYPGSEDAEPNE